MNSVARETGEQVNKIADELQDMKVMYGLINLRHPI